MEKVAFNYLAYFSATSLIMVIINTLEIFYYCFYYVDVCAGVDWGCCEYISAKCLQMLGEDVGSPGLELQVVVSCPM